MKTYIANYYGQKAFALIFSIAFLGGSIYGLINPDNFTVYHNDQIVETNFITLLPFLTVGILSLLLFIWMVKNYFRVRMDEDGITILKLNNYKKFTWTDIESIDDIKWLWKGTIFKVKPKNGKTFYFHSDRPTMSLGDFFSSGFRTEMAEYVKTKKTELGI